MSLNFSELYLVIDEEIPSTEALNLIFSDTNDKYTDSDTTWYLIKKEILDGKYFWLDVRYGQSQPRPDNVYNTKRRKEENNPRSLDQVEQNKQLFGLYCSNSHTFYLSSQNKQSWVEDYLNKKSPARVTVKKLFKSPEEIAQQIKKIKSVTFAGKNDLVSPGEEIMDIFSNPANPFGLGMPAYFRLKTCFKNVPISDAFIQYLRKITPWINRKKSNSLVCVGLDDKNFETAFCIKNYTRKISVDAAKDDQNLYDSTAVKNALIEKIRDLHEDNS